MNSMVSFQSIIWAVATVLINVMLGNSLMVSLMIGAAVLVLMIVVNMFIQKNRQ